MAARLIVTVAIVYAIHFAPNVVRETYLAVAVGESLSIRVDRFVGLHPDLFEIPGRGAYINNNPGVSFLAAVPYAIVRPVLEQLYRWRPELVAPKPPATYDDPRPNRTLFMNEMRARGLDVRLGMAAIAIHLGYNVPAGVLATLVMFFFLRARLRDERAALWLALLFAFGTPVFFRTAFLNQNLAVAHCTLFALVALTWSTSGSTGPPRLDAGRLAAAGACLGVALLCDYSAAPLLLVFGLWATMLGVRDLGVPAGLRAGAMFVLGAAGPIAALCLYQYAAFGHALLPAQAHMPATDLSGDGWNGVRAPSIDLLWRNLFDPAYGLFVFCPMLAAACWAPRYGGRTGSVAADELVLIYGASLALYVFSSSIAFAGLQWNTGVRYLVPAVPLLFVALVPVLLHAPRGVVALLVAPTLVISWSVSMARETVPHSLARIATGGLELPWHTVLERTASAYLPALPRTGVPLAIVLLAAGFLWLLWRPRAAPEASPRAC